MNFNILSKIMSTIVTGSSGNRNRHRTPLEKKYRLTKLLCIEESRWKRLRDLVDSNKRSWKRILRKPVATYTDFFDYDTEDLRVIMSNWYHGQFTGIKTSNCTEEQLWGDLTVEQNMKLQRILKGEF